MEPRARGDFNATRAGREASRSRPGRTGAQPGQRSDHGRSAGAAAPCKARTRRIALRYALALAAVLGSAFRSHAQAVSVTMSLDNPTISISQTSTLHVYAQVIPSLRTNADRIFSWYINVLNTNGTVAGCNWSLMQKTASDQDPQTSSTGVSQGSNRVGIYDTFLNLPGAGTSNRVELLSVPVTGLAVGTTLFQVQAGTGQPDLSSDFLVAPKGGGQPYIGGDYSAALVNLNVITSAPCTPQLHVTDLSPGPGGFLLLTFTPCPSRNNTVESRSSLSNGVPWQALPGAPHNSGSVTVTNSSSPRFFRVRASLP